MSTILTVLKEMHTLFSFYGAKKEGSSKIKFSHTSNKILKWFEKGAKKSYKRPMISK